MPLRFTGLDDNKKQRLKDLIDSCLMGCEIIIDGSGNAILRDNNEAGPPSLANQAFKQNLERVIDNRGTTRIRITDGDSHIEGDSFARECIDLQDMESLGARDPQNQDGITSWSAMIHAIVEQFEKQINGLDYHPRRNPDGTISPGAHRRALDVEEDVTGGRLGRASCTKRGNTTTYVECWIYPAPRGTKYTKWQVRDGNITGPPTASDPPSGGLRQIINEPLQKLEKIVSEKTLNNFAEFALSTKLMEEITNIPARTEETRSGRVYTDWTTFEEDVKNWKNWIHENESKVIFNPASWTFDYDSISEINSQFSSRPQINDLENVENNLIKNIQIAKDLLNEIKQCKK